MKRLLYCAMLICGLISLTAEAEKAGWADRNSDGQVTRREFFEAHAGAAEKSGRKFNPAATEQLFASKDVNRDGILTGDEVLAGSRSKQGGAGNEPYTPPEAIEQCHDIQFDPALPNVLLIGDSISIQYTPIVRERLKGIANVARPFNGSRRQAVNCGSTEAGLQGLDTWLGTNHWDVIHFNWGLHDLCYRNPAVTNLYGNRDKINGTLSVSLEQYASNLEQLVVRLKQTGAKLVWASITVVPENEAGRFVGDDAKYNQAALKIMEKYGVALDDLHSLSSSFPPEYFSAPGDVHYVQGGFETLGNQVADVIENQLKGKQEP